MGRTGPLILFIILCILIPLPGNTSDDASGISEDARGVDTILTGTWEVEYLVRDPGEHLVPVSIRTLGYRQTVQRIHRGYRITVKSIVEPVILQDDWRLTAEPEVTGMPEFDGLADTLAAVTDTAGAVRAVLGWLDTAVPYRDVPGSPQDPDAVLKRGSGNCVGRATLAARILNDLRIPCRTVRGCLYKDGSAAFHRWIEVDYPGAGALPSDPGATQDFVTPYHLILLPSETADHDAHTLSDLDASIEIRSENRTVWAIDQRPLPDGCRVPLERRRTSAGPMHSALTARIETASPADCRMTIESARFSRTCSADRFGNVSVVPLPSGSYQVIISAPGYRPDRRRVDIGIRERVHIHTTLKPTATGGI